MLLIIRKLAEIIVSKLTSFEPKLKGPKHIRRLVTLAYNSLLKAIV